MTQYRYITAAEWGGTWVRPPQHEHPLDPEGFLHHTAGNPMSDRTAEEAFRVLNRFAQDGKGYSFLDYDMLVHWEAARDIVTIGEGRGKWMSAATRDRNELGEAVVVLGYFHPGSSLSEHPKTRHIEGAARAFVKLVEWGLLARDFTLLGHRDNPAHPGATGCPGAYWYPEPMARLQARIDELLAPPPQPPTPTEDDLMFIVKHSDGTFHLGDGMYRTYCAAPTNVINAYKRAGRPLKDWVSGKDVNGTGDVSTGDAKQLGLDPSKMGPRTFKAE